MLYQGDNKVLNDPKIITDDFYKDFGYGFYCTNFEKHVVNVYSYTENKNLDCLIFKEMSDEWLDFVVSSRQGERYDYDIVEGPMADDTIWNYVDDFARGFISRTAFWELVKFKYPTHQIVFCTEAALKCLEYARSYEL